MKTTLTSGQFACFIDQFFNFEDAENWVENHMYDHPKDEWEIVECRINLIGGIYRAGVSFKKIVLQPELPFFEDGC